MGQTMERFVFFLRPLDPSEIDNQREACQNMAGEKAKVVAEFIDYGRDRPRVFRQALAFCSDVGATLVCGEACFRVRPGRSASCAL